MRGYFHVPEAGRYTFYGIVDDNLLLKISKYPGTANLENLQTVIEIQSHNSNRYISEMRENTTKPSSSRNL